MATIYQGLIRSNLQNKSITDYHGTADYQMAIARYKVDLSSSMNPRIIREPRPALKEDVAINFEPELYQLVPELKNLSDEDVEKVIGESHKFDFESD